MSITKLPVFLFSREDGKDSVKFYTDPGYFFELWFQDIQKDIENRKTELKAKRKRVSHKLLPVGALLEYRNKQNLCEGVCHL